jgi:putative ABC transport system ATP-binding protein
LNRFIIIIFASENIINTIIQLENVNKTYPVGEGTFSALTDVNLEIRKGEFLGITGKSGAGKTTLLNMIAGVSHLSSGNIQFFPPDNSESINGEDTIQLQNMDEDQIAKWRGENLGIVYQSFELIPSLSLVENVMFPPDLLGNYHRVGSKERALQLLADVEILEHAYKIPAHISGGQMQRVAIARALINEPSLIIADEPTGNLDSVTAETIFQLFENLVESGKTVVMVTHDDSLAPRFTRRLHITDGKVEEIVGTSANQSSINSTHEIVTEEVEKEAEEFVSQINNISTAQSSIGSEIKAFPAVVLHNVDKIFQTPAGNFTALKSIDIQLDYGKFISIVGKSGSGKSTLINMITGIDHPTQGEIIVGNQHIYEMNESERSLWRGKNMGVVFQFFQLLPTLTLLENTMLPMDYCDIYPFAERPQRAMEILKRVGLEEHAHKLPASVSSGQQQSAAIARSLATDPSLILADEPTGNLDSKSAKIILDLFEDLAKEGKTVIIVTHDPSITKRTDQTIILSDGEIIDETISRALPMLSHPLMLAATKSAKRKKYESSELILQQGVEVDYFFMIVSGEVDILVTNEYDKEFSLARLGVGQFFGEVELTKGSNSIASVRAAAAGVELALLPKVQFYEIVDGSSLTRNNLNQVASDRLDENNRRRKEAK